jgi:adenylylsulfate kinase
MDRSPGWTIWLTGLPASGKTTLARALRGKLNEQGISVVLLDSDEVRRILTPRATYTSQERDSFYERLIAFAVWLVGCGENVIIVATGSQRGYRASARAQLAPRFAEVWVRCPIEVCRSRDPKGLYAGAVAGVIHNLPGVDAVYEAPEAPEVVVDTDRQTPEEAAETVLASVPFVQSTANRAHHLGALGYL